MSDLAGKLIEENKRTKNKKLDLGNCGLREIPDEVFECVWLEELILSNQWWDMEQRKWIDSSNKGPANILSNIPPQTGKLTQLKVLRISGDYDTRWNLHDVSNLLLLANLRQLDISSNQLTEKGAESIAKLSALNSLDISYNQLTEKGAESIAKLSALNSLDISYNQLTEKGAESIAKLSALNILDISSNQLTDKGAESIAKLSALNSLDISSNKLTDKGAESIAKLSALNILDISSNQLTEKGAESIAKLSALNSLYISSNQLTDRGAESIAKLSALNSLDISYNQLTEKGAESIAKLSALNSLFISSNQLTEKGAESIAKLSALNSLFISSNQLTDKGAESIAKLSALNSLFISSNQLTDKGAESIAKLSALNSLDISSNQLTDKGTESIAKLSALNSLYIRSNQLTDKGTESIAKLSALNSLDISFNKIKNSATIKNLLTSLPLLKNLFFFGNEINDLPNEIMYDINALRSYFASTDKVRNTLVKMMLIGNTTAGKSSLAYFLVKKKYKPNRDSTHGIQLWRWRTPKKPNALQVNIWDFGGQDYYHTTHNLFLNDKTIFLLLHTDKEKHLKNGEEKQYLLPNYWLGNIRSITNKDSAVWYIQSKSENEELVFLDTELVNRYNVSRQYKISVLSAFNDQENKTINIDFNYFLANLMQQLQEMVKDKLPVSWVAIRDTHLPKWREDDLYLSFDGFMKKCEDALQHDSKLKDDFRESRDGLLTYLKGTGEVVHFEDKPELADMIFLSAQKLTQGIYDVLSKEALENKGEFTMADLEKQDISKAKIYLNVLKGFNIIFEKPGEENVYVAPQYLPENPHTKRFQQLIKIAYVIHFPDYMSRSLITNFLVKYAGNNEENYYWRYGAFFKLNDLNVFVRIDADLQKIYVHIEDGPAYKKFEALKELFLFFTGSDKTREAAALLRHDSENIEDERKRGEVHRENDKWKQIELSLNDVDFVSINDIRDAISKKVYKIKSKQGNYIEFNAIIHKLLNTNSPMPKKIFLSYSHKDEEYKKELDTHFAALKRSGKVDTWHDRKIVAGTDWDKSIEEALLSSDIVLLLLSPDFMASDYIWLKEIAKAKDKNIPIVPIFLRPCDFKETVFEISKIQGFPKNTRWIVSSHFAYRDEAYLEIIEELKKIL